MAKVLVVVVVALAVLALQVEAKGAVTKQKEMSLQVQKHGQKSLFDWNLQTIAAGVGVKSFDKTSTIYAPRTTWPGIITTTRPGGHNFATRRAVDYAIAAAGPTGAAALVKMMKVKDIAELQEDRDKQSVAVYALLYGNFQNELRVNLDAESGMAAAGAWAIWGTFRNDPEIARPDGKRSHYYNPATGYSSANPIHSMLQSSKNPVANAATWTQQQSMGVLLSFAKRALTEAITLLKADDGKITVATRKSYPAGWAKALRLIGSVFHTIQDSACACTTSHWESWAPKAVQDCIAGDGHGVLVYDGARKLWLVTGLSDSIFYDNRLHFHEVLDQQYVPTQVLTIPELLKTRAAIDDAAKRQKKLFGSYDPAIGGGHIILDVMAAVASNKAAATSADEIVRNRVASRYVAPSQLRMPSINESTCRKARYQRKPEPANLNCAQYK